MAGRYVWEPRQDFVLGRGYVNKGRMELVYKPSDQEIDAIGKGVENLVRETVNLSVELSTSFYNDIAKPIFWWAARFLS